MDLDGQLNEVEKLMIVKALTMAGGVQVKAARILGIKERSLWHRVKKHGIDPSRFKEKTGE